MSEVQDKATLVFEDKNYVIDDLSDQAKYFVSQLQDLNQQANATKARLDQLDVARKGFTDLLREALSERE